MFPCLVLRRTAIDLKVAQKVEPLLTAGFGLQTYENLLREAYLEQFHDREAAYYYHIDRRRKLHKKGLLLLTSLAEEQLLANPAKFPAFADRSGYDGSTPSDGLLQEAWYQLSELREHWYHRQAQLVHGKVLSGDAAHKLVKGVRLFGAKIIRGIYTVLNEWNQVVLQRPMLHDSVGSIAEVEPDLGRLAQRFQMMGFPPVELTYSDNCCADRPVWDRAFERYGAEAGSSAASSAAGAAPPPALAFPERASPTRIITSAATMQFVEKACASLMQSARAAAACHSLQPVLGVRVLWNSAVIGKPVADAILVAAVDGTAFFFQMRGAQQHGVPPCIIDMLENDAMVKVGFSLRADAQYLRESACIDVKPLEHLPSFAVQMAPSYAADGSAAGISASTLLRALPEQTAGIDWRAAGLPDKLVEEACLEPYAACWVHQRVLALADPIHRPGPDSRADLPVGAQLRLYGKSNTVCVAEGTVQEYTALRWGPSILVNPIPPDAGDDGPAAAAKTRAVTNANKHVVVTITKVVMPNALLRNVCPDGKRRTLSTVGIGQPALWDVVSALSVADPA
jgi:hypothetical protein